MGAGHRDRHRDFAYANRSKPVQHRNSSCVPFLLSSLAQLTHLFYSHRTIRFIFQSNQFAMLLVAFSARRTIKCHNSTQRGIAGHEGKHTIQRQRAVK